MHELRVKLFGPASVTVDGRPVKLKPLALTVLIRLIVADGAPVTVDELFRDCWPPTELVIGDYRTQVQKRILEIRRAVDSKWSSEAGGESTVLPTQRGRITAYRLAVDRDSADVLEFIELVTKARRSSQEERIEFLERAASLWADQPLFDVADKPWAAQLARHVEGLHREAEHELAHAYELAGRVHDALDVAEKLAAASPDDARIASRVANLRRQARANQGKRVVREEFAALKTAVVVMTGDLFDQDDANLVVGFSDTFDTDIDIDIDRNIVISAESTQGVLLRRLYDGDRRQLDKELRAALSRTPKVAVESRSAKPRGKLTRYPVGTVATLHHATRRVFAVAYSRMSNELMAQSSLPLLQTSLDNLWDAVYRYGQLKPVAMPLIGTGLSRTGATDEDLLTVIVSSFTASAYRRYIGPELRIVVPQPVFDLVKIPEIVRSIRGSGPLRGESGRA
jgi:DNA-binding SARP family transcriptional activator